VARRRANNVAVPPRESGGLDVNAVVSYNLRTIRQRQGWTQEGVAQRLAQLTGHELPQASISAMERGFEGGRRRRFDAHELYLFSVVFGVPIVYFFIPPPIEEREDRYLADTERPVSELYAAVLGVEGQLNELDERLTDLGRTSPADAEMTLALIYGPGGGGPIHDWYAAFRTWRKRRLLALARDHGDRLDDIADFLATFGTELKNVGPQAYLQMKAHRDGEEVLPAATEPEEG
jgi:transcriptional regulator with XRE-family HTH domain